MRCVSSDISRAAFFTPFRSDKKGVNCGNHEGEAICSPTSSLFSTLSLPKTSVVAFSKESTASCDGIVPVRLILWFVVLVLNAKAGADKGTTLILSSTTRTPGTAFAIVTACLRAASLTAEPVNNTSRPRFSISTET